MPSNDTFGSRRQKISNEFTEATDDFRNSLYVYAIDDMPASHEFIELYDDFAKAMQRFQLSITYDHTRQRLQVLDMADDDVLHEKAQMMNESGLDYINGALGEEDTGSLEKFSEAALESELVEVANEVDLYQYEEELRENIAELGIPPSDTEEIYEEVSDAIERTNEGGIDGSTGVLNEKLQMIAERRDIDNGDYGVEKNCEPILTYYAAGTAVFGGLGLYYCVWKNNTKKCDGVKKAAKAAATFGSGFKGIQFG